MVDKILSMAAMKKKTLYSKWGMLEAVGITEHLLLGIFANDESEDVLKCTENIPDVPTYGILIELYHFASDNSSALKLKVNRLLKVLVDTLFPLCSVTRADRLERRIKGLCLPLDSMSEEAQALYLQKQWIPQPTGVKAQATYVTNEMKKHGLYVKDLEHMIANPSKCSWTLNKPASARFYTDLHDLLHKRRIPLEEIGMIYRAIDPDLCRKTAGNKDAYYYVSRGFLFNQSSDIDEECTAIATYESSQESNSDKENTSDEDVNRYLKHNVKRREKRAQSKIKGLQTSLNYFKHLSKEQEKQLHQTSIAMKEYMELIHERNSQIKHLENLIKNLDEMNSFLECELTDLRQETDSLHESHEVQISQLTEQIKELQLHSSFTTLESKSFTTNVRELYYSLLSLHVPPARIKPIVQNVICRLMPSLKLNNVRLPSKSCAAYMRSAEMPTISSLQKAAELAKSEQWCLNSDGTTLQQAKKVAFLINGIVLGVHDVSDGSSETALDALKAELQKIGKSSSDITHIVSSTSDGASAQCKFNCLLEKESGKPQGTIVENKCAMHLGVNLRHAQVKAMEDIQATDSSIAYDSEGSMDEDMENPKKRYSDIDCFVYEVCKAFGHLGCPEYGQGASSFRVFIASKIKQSCDDEKEYYTKAEMVFFERQVGSRYYVTSCNAGRVFYLKRAIIAFLKEQEFIKSLNQLESACLKKLQDPLLITKTHMEGLMFDRVYADLMMLVKSKELNKTALDMNVHYKELLDFLQRLIDTPSLILNREHIVFPSEPRLYSNDKKLNHRLRSKYVPIQQMLYQDACNSSLSSLVHGASKAMSKKLESYKKDHLPGGRYYDSDLETQTILSKLQPHNDKTESVFGTNDWLHRILPNMAQETRTAMIEFSYNSTMDWLKNQGEEQKRTLVALAQKRRHLVIEQSRNNAKQLLEKKMVHRAKLIEKGKEKAEKIAAAIEDLKTDILITTVDGLQKRETAIVSLSLPEKLKEAELKVLVKRQIQLRTKVYKQKGIRVLSTANGKAKCASRLLKELSDIILKYPVQVEVNSEEPSHQMLHILFDRPSLLASCRIKHRFEQDGSLVWYEGEILSCRKQQVRVHYPETYEMCQFTLDEIKDDFYSGDLWIV